MAMHRHANVGCQAVVSTRAGGRKGKENSGKEVPISESKIRVLRGAFNMTRLCAVMAEADERAVLVCEKVTGRKKVR